MLPGTDVDHKEKKMPQQVTTRSSGIRRFLRKSVAWVGIAVPFAIHIGLVVQNLRLGHHGTIPEFADVSGAGFAAWVSAYAVLFVRSDTWPVMARLYALWTVVFLVLSVYRALRSESNILDGVTQFLAHGLAAVLILAVITPALWVLLAGWGPVIVELTPPLVLVFIGVLLTRSALHASR